MLKYEQIANEIENYIYENDIPQGTKLPTVENLAVDYQVSKSTIVKALESLVLKGLVYQVRGSGIFVRKKKWLFDLIMTGLTNQKTFISHHKVLEFDVIRPDEELIKSLECDPNEEVYMIKRIRYLNDDIMCYEESYYKKSIVPFLTKEIAERSIFEYLTSALNLNLGFSDSYIHIELLDSKVAKLLDLDTTSPAMIFLQQLYLSSGQLFNFTKLTYHYKHVKFFLQSSSIK